MDIKENFYQKLQQLREDTEQIDELSPGRANDAYHTAAEKGKTADIMTGLTKSKKWKNIADKRWSQARKFADYSDKKKK